MASSFMGYPLVTGRQSPRAAKLLLAGGCNNNENGLVQ
jgi:hypothetical protein